MPVEPVELYVAGLPLSSGNPLPTSVGGGVSTNQGAPNAGGASSWPVVLEQANATVTNTNPLFVEASDIPFSQVGVAGAGGTATCRVYCFQNSSTTPQLNPSNTAVDYWVLSVASGGTGLSLLALLQAVDGGTSFANVTGAVVTTIAGNNINYNAKNGTIIPTGDFFVQPGATWVIGSVPASFLPNLSVGLLAGGNNIGQTVPVDAGALFQTYAASSGVNTSNFNVINTATMTVSGASNTNLRAQGSSDGGTTFHAIPYVLNGTQMFTSGAQQGTGASWTIAIDVRGYTHVFFDSLTATQTFNIWTYRFAGLGSNFPVAFQSSSNTYVGAPMVQAVMARANHGIGGSGNLAAQPLFCAGQLLEITRGSPLTLGTANTAPTSLLAAVASKKNVVTKLALIVSGADAAGNTINLTDGVASGATRLATVPVANGVNIIDLTDIFVQNSASNTAIGIWGNAAGGPIVIYGGIFGVVR